MFPIVLTRVIYATSTCPTFNHITETEMAVDWTYKHVSGSI